MAGQLVGLVISVEAAASVDEALRAGIAVLLPQLSSSAAPPTRDSLRRVVDTPGTTLFVAHDGDTLVGMLTLVVFEIPTAVRAWIEDVVVDQSVRGAGVGAALVQAALERAAALGVRTVDLTSRPHREAAHRLYLRMGFEVRNTNVYRCTLDDGA